MDEPAEEVVVAESGRDYFAVALLPRTTCLTQRINQMVLECQLTHKTVNLLFRLPIKTIR